jgi:hypothetical protein
MDVKVLFDMQDNVRKFITQDKHPNLQLANALGVIDAALRCFDGGTRDLIIAEVIKRRVKPAATESGVADG